MPLVYARANDPRTYDATGMGPGNDRDFMGGLSEQSSDPPLQAGTASGDEVRVVREMSLGAFRRRLIEHFNILWRKGEVQWPSRTGVVEWAPP